MIKWARVAKLADAPDLGIPNRRFQNIAFHFTKKRFYERKTAIFCEIVAIRRMDE